MTYALQIMDCPGLFDTGKTNQEVATQLLAALSNMAGPTGTSGPDVICYVIGIGGYTEEEYAVYQRLKALLGEEARRYILPVFTHADRLKGKDVREMATPQCLTQVLQDCGHRLAVLDNTSPDRAQHVTRLLDTARAMKAENGGKPFQCPAHGASHVTDRLGQVERSEAERTRFVQQLHTRVGQAEQAASQQRQTLAARSQQEEQAAQQRAADLQTQVNDVSARLGQQQTTTSSLSSQLQALQQRQASEQQQRQRQLQQQQAQHAATLQQKVNEIAALK